MDGRRLKTRQSSHHPSADPHQKPATLQTSHYSAGPRSWQACRCQATRNVVDGSKFPLKWNGVNTIPRGTWAVSDHVYPCPAPGTCWPPQASALACTPFVRSEQITITIQTVSNPLVPPHPTSKKGRRKNSHVRLWGACEWDAPTAVRMGPDHVPGCRAN